MVYVLNLALVAGAFRLHRGQQGLGMGFLEFLRRSALAAIGLTILMPVIWVIEEGLMGKSFEIATLVAVLLLPLGAQFLNWVYGLDEWTSGFGVFILFLVIPVLLTLATLHYSLPVP